jgi:hypothetical protein
MSIRRSGVSARAGWQERLALPGLANLVARSNESRQINAMKEETRRAIAHAAATHINGSVSPTLFSYERGRHTHMSPTYDYEAGPHISRTGSGLYHYGTSSHISFSVNGNNFSGYDYASGHHYTGHVSRSTVQLYDYGEGRYFTYSI